MNARERDSLAAFEDTLRRLLPDLLDRDDDPLLAEWTLVLSTVSGTDADAGGMVDVLSPDGALLGHVIGAVRIALVTLEAQIFEEP